MITLDFNVEDMDGYDKPCISLIQSGQNVEMMMWDYIDLDAQAMDDDYDARVPDNCVTVSTVEELINALQEATRRFDNAV